MDPGVCLSMSSLRDAIALIGNPLASPFAMICMGMGVGIMIEHLHSPLPPHEDDACYKLRTLLPSPPALHTHQNIRGNTKVLYGKHLARASEPGLHLVCDQKYTLCEGGSGYG